MPVSLPAICLPIDSSIISRFFGSRSSFQRVLAFGSLCVFASQAARADTYTWRGGAANNNWSTAANWLGNAAPPSDLDNTDLIFGASDAIFPSITPAYSIHSLTWNAGASAYFFDSGPLTLGSGGFTQNAANAQTFSAPVILGADQTWTLADGAGALTFNGGVNTTGGPDGANRTLTINAATTTGSGNVINGNLTGASSLTKTGAGVLTLTGASTYAGNTTVNAGTLAIGTGGSITGGRVTVNAGATLSISGNVGTGSTRIFTVDGAAANPASVSLIAGSLSTGNAFVGRAGSGAFNHSGGSFTTNGGTLSLGDNSGSSGIYNLSGSASSLSTGLVSIGVNGSGTFNHSGGSFTTNGKDFYLALALGASGAYNLSGSASSLSTGAVFLGLSGNATFNQSGGSFTTNGNALSFGYPGGSGNSTYNLNGGTLAAGSIIKDGIGTSTFNFNGGALQPGVANASFLQGLTTANVQAGGARVDTTGFDITIAQALLHDTISDAPAIDGGLTKLGAGTLTLTGANTYTGGATFAAGVLNVGSAGALGSTGPLAFNGGALQYSPANQSDYSARFATTAGQLYKIDTNGQNVSLATGLTSAGGSLIKTGAGTLTLAGASTYTGNTTVSAGTLLISGSVSSGSSGSLTVDGAATNPASVSLGSGSLSTGTAYVGFTGVGSMTQSGGTFTTNGGTLSIGKNAGSSGAYTLSGGSLSTDSVYVGLNGSGVFTQSGGAFTTNGGLLVIGTNAGGVGAYTLSGAGSLTTSSTYISADANTGVFTQSGASTHTTGALYVGAAVFSAPGNATYYLDGGTLAANNVTRLNAVGVFNFNGGTLQPRRDNTAFFQGLTTANVRGGGAVIDTAGFNVTVANNLTHSDITGDAALDGGLTKNGAGTLTLSGANTFTGPLAINAGTLAVAAESALGAPIGGVTTVNGGGQLLFTGSATLGRTYNLGVSTLSVGASNTLTFGVGSSINGGFLAGPGANALGNGATFNGVTTLVSSTLTQAAGSTATLNTTTLRGALTQTGGTLALNNASVSPSGRVSVGGTFNTNRTESFGVITVNSGGTLANGGGSLYLGGGSRTTVNASGTLSAASGTTIELNGGLLTNNGAQTGALNVNFGGVAKGSGSFGTVNVGDGGRFGANTSSGGASVNGLATFRLKGAETAFVGPQLRVVPGTANVGSLTLNSGSLLAVSVQDARGAAGAGYDTALVQGALTLNGYRTAGDQITIALSSLGSNGSAGAAANFDPSQSYVLTLVTASGGITGFDAASFQVDTSSFQNSLGGGRFFVAQDGNNLNLDFTPVPEPATWLGGALLLVGAAGTIRRRVRRSA